MQLKEKFGGLRLYTGGIPIKIADQVEELISEASKESEFTCIMCGKPAKMCYYYGWCPPYCEKCLHKSWHEANNRSMRILGKSLWNNQVFDYDDFVCKEESEENDE